LIACSLGKTASGRRSEFPRNGDHDGVINMLKSLWSYTGANGQSGVMMFCSEHLGL
jgi:hypothetical protein